jgi:hypothetical protein
MRALKRKIKDILLELQSLGSIANARFFRRGDIFGIRQIDPAAERLWRSSIVALSERGEKLPPLHTIGYRSYSQFDEDGILQAILATIGVSQGLSVEIGIGDGRECNTSHLLFNHGWQGLLIDANAPQVRRAERFFNHAKDTRAFPPTVVCARVSEDNINELFESLGFSKDDFDVFSLDIDSKDYWILKAMEFRPKVIVAEVRGWFPPDRAVTVPENWTYDPAYPEYYGQSLAGAEAVLRERGYSLVGVNKYCSNAFFVRGDLMKNTLPAPSVEECSVRPRAMALRESLWPTLSHLPWTDVSG